jgi:2',3'-cyclic-nucleotide 2'-phosphodiesterase (5'-nucleotidase family)
MKKTLSFLVLIFIGAGFSACSFGIYKKISFKTIPIQNNKNLTLNSVDSIVNPYKISIDKEMNQVIAKAAVDFVKNKPNGNLNNLIADIILSTKKDFQIQTENVICLQNIGGLRAPINKGDVTLGDIFKVLPFDNFVVAVKLPPTSIPKIIAWITASNGHPVAGCKITKDQIIMNNLKILDTDFWVITSDYLLNGGDNASFFSDKLELKESGILLRDVVINYLKINPLLLDDNKERIKLN